MNYARAQEDLSHDLSGTNFVNSPVPIIFIAPVVAPAAGTAGGPAAGTAGGPAEGTAGGPAEGNSQVSPVVARATQLSQDLQNAYNASTSNDPVGDQQLSSAIENAEDFLNDLTEQAERARSAERARIW